MQMCFPSRIDTHRRDGARARKPEVGGRGSNLPDPSSSLLLKQLSIILLFSSSNLSALFTSRPLVAMAASATARSNQSEADELSYGASSFRQLRHGRRLGHSAAASFDREME